MQARSIKLKLKQKQLLQKYRPQISLTNDEIALQAGFSHEIVRRTLNGTGCNTAVLKVIYNDLTSDGKALPADLKRFFVEINFPN